MDKLFYYIRLNCFILLAMKLWTFGGELKKIVGCMYFESSMCGGLDYFLSVVLKAN